MTDQPSLLRRLAGAAVGGLRLLAVGVAALALAVVAAVAAVIGAAARLLAAMIGELARLTQAALPWLLGLAPWLARAAVAGAACYAVVVTWPGVFLAYRADMPALPAGALASVVVVCPIALAVIARRWGALLGAIAVMFIVGRGLIVAGPLWRAFAIVIVMAVMAMTSVFSQKGESEDELRGDYPQRREQPAEESAAGDSGVGDGVYDMEFSADDDGA